MARTSVIIPTFNRAHLLGETLAAVLGQTRAVDEVIVVDDGSTDDTAERAAAFGSRIALISQANAGKPAALNRGLAAASGERIWIVDDDDLPRPDAHETLAGLLERQPEAGFAYGRHDRFVVYAESKAKRFFGTGYWGEDDPDRFLISTLEEFFVHQPGLIVRADLYRRAGPFDTRLEASEDYDMLVRLALLAKPVSTDRVVFDQRHHPGLRGAAGRRYAEADRARKWIEWDQVIFKRLLADLPLEIYLPPSERDPGPADPVLLRRARMQRGVVAARRKMWPQAFEDFRAAACDGSQIEVEDAAVLRRTLLSKYGVDELRGDPSVVGGLRALKRQSATGRAMVRHIARGLPWRVKNEALHGRLGAAGGFAGLWARAMV